MSPLNFGYFNDRTEEDLFFGKLEHLSNQEIYDLAKFYLQDVVRYLFGEFPNNKRIIVPKRNLSPITRVFSKEELKYHFAGKYFIFESHDISQITEFVEYFKNLFNCRFPLSHYHYSDPSLPNSTRNFLFTENTKKIHDILPFPKYILWAFEKTNRLNVSEPILFQWLTRDIKRLSEIKISNISEDILRFDVILESRPFSVEDWH